MSNLFNFEGLTPMQIGRINKCLDKLFRWDGEVMSVRERLEKFHKKGLLLSKHVSDKTIDYNRHKFNCMRGDEQAVYERRLRDGRYYWYDYSEGFSSQIPKIVYDCLNLRVKD